MSGAGSKQRSPSRHSSHFQVALLPVATSNSEVDHRWFFFLIWFTHRDINVDNIPILKRSAETETEHTWWSTDLNKEKCENERPPTTTANPACYGDKPHGAGAAGVARSDLCLSLITPHFMRNTGSKHCCLKISWFFKEIDFLITVSLQTAKTIAVNKICLHYCVVKIE